MADRLALGVVPILRRGEISPTLAQFRLYWFVALDMERQKARRKIDLMRPEGDPRRERALYCMERQEEVLDRAYADMCEMAPKVGGRAVEVITAHYLEGEDWHDLSARIGIAYDKCKEDSVQGVQGVRCRDIEKAAGERNPCGLFVFAFRAWL